MTVGALKKILQNYSDDTEIFKDMCGPDLPTNKWDFVVKPVTYAMKGRIAMYDDKTYAKVQRPSEETKDAKLCLII